MGLEVEMVEDEAHGDALGQVERPQLRQLDKCGLGQGAGKRASDVGDEGLDGCVEAAVGVEDKNINNSDGGNRGSEQVGDEDARGDEEGAQMRKGRCGDGMGGHRGCWKELGRKPNGMPGGVGMHRRRKPKKSLSKKSGSKTTF